MLVFGNAIICVHWSFFNTQLSLPTYNFYVTMGMRSFYRHSKMKFWYPFENTSRDKCFCNNLVHLNTSKPDEIWTHFIKPCYFRDVCSSDIGIKVTCLKLAIRGHFFLLLVEAGLTCYFLFQGKNEISARKLKHPTGVDLSFVSHNPHAFGCPRINELVLRNYLHILV